MQGGFCNRDEAIFGLYKHNRNMRIHLIAIGGKVMHNLALELQGQGHEITGSDDEIYDPARSRLSAVGLLPDQMGWAPQRIDSNIDIIILGMHAQKDNPELLAAQDMGLSIMSFPEFIGETIKARSKIVVAGSHGKSTITAMIMHVLNYLQIESDYVLGGMLAGFKRMVSLSGASIAVIEGDEYLSSRVDSTSKMMHYHGDIVVISGIEWDHMNVFPTVENYIEQFEKLIEQTTREGGKVIWYEGDPYLGNLMREVSQGTGIAYDNLKVDDSGAVVWDGKQYPIAVFGDHNLANMNAARLACIEVGVNAGDFFAAIASFEGVGKRLELIFSEPVVYLDYAHAPSKVRATVHAVRSRHRQSKILAVYELHTYSSLNAQFLPHYEDTMSRSDQAVIYYDNHALAMKQMPALERNVVKEAFGEGTHVYRDQSELKDYLMSVKSDYDVILMMSSGTFGGLDLDEIFGD